MPHPLWYVALDLAGTVTKDYAVPIYNVYKEEKERKEGVKKANAAWNRKMDDLDDRIDDLRDLYAVQQQNLQRPRGRSVDTPRRDYGGQYYYYDRR